MIKYFNLIYKTATLLLWVSKSKNKDKRKRKIASNRSRDDTAILAHGFYRAAKSYFEKGKNRSKVCNRRKTQKSNKVSIKN